MTDDEALRGARGDRENLPAESSWLEAGYLVEPVRKLAISLRLDPGVIDWFRSTGPRYQSRMNAVLRAYVEHRMRGVAPPSNDASSGRTRGR
ncbi:MAG: BrnA antitoxin family protein [Gemmatimonadaceae bacterium]